MDDNLEEFGDPVNYDLEHEPRARARIAFWVRQAARFGGPVLDLACGTGLVALPLAQAGHDVTGTDLAAPMLAHARAKARRAGLRVDWVEADLRTLALPTRFALAILTGNAFQAMLTRDDQRALLATVRRHLAPGGVFGFETRNPAGHALCDEPEGPPEHDYLDVDGQRVVLTSSQRWDAAAQVIHWTSLRRWCDRHGALHERTTRIACRFTAPADVRALLAEAGFEIFEELGDWNDAPFVPDGERLIVLCRRGVD